MIDEVRRGTKRVSDDEVSSIILCILDDISDHGKENVTIQDIWFEINQVESEASTIKSLFQTMDFSIERLPSKLSPTVYHDTIESNPPLLERLLNKKKIKNIRSDLLGRWEQSLAWRKEGILSFIHVPKWHYKVVIEMLYRISKHGEKISQSCNTRLNLIGY